MSKTSIRRSHTVPAISAHWIAPSHRAADTFSSCDRINGAGNAHSLRESESNLAESLSKLPSICAEPPQIGSLIVGAVVSFHATNIAICLLVYVLVKLQNISLPFSLKDIDTIGFPS